MTLLLIVASVVFVSWLALRYWNHHQDDLARHTPRDHRWHQVRTLVGTRDANIPMVSVYEALTGVTKSEHPKRGIGAAEARVLYTVELPEHDGSAASQITPVVRYYLGGSDEVMRKILQITDSRFSNAELIPLDQSPIAAEIDHFIARHRQPKETPAGSAGH